MKKLILIAAALLLMVPVANAQLKPAADQKKAVEAAKANATNPKKAGKAATWMKLGEAYFKAFTDATGGVLTGQDEMTANFYLQAKPVSQEEATIEGQPAMKMVYSTVNVYFQNGVVVAIEPTDLAYPDGLSLAAEAYAKAYELDPKKAKDARDQIDLLAQRLHMLAACWYELGDYPRSSADFERVYDMSVLTDLTEASTDALSNAILISSFAEDYARVRELCDKALAAGYENDGDVYAKLGDAYGKLGDPASQKEALEKGFNKYPECENLLISLINYATANDEPTDYVYSLLHKAQELEPNNPSLWYVEGNILLENKEFDAALEKYRMAQEINPEYMFGFFQEGVLWATRYDALLAEATVLPANTPMAVFDEYDAKMQDCLEKAVKVQEHCFENGDDRFKLASAQFLKQWCFMLRSVDSSYAEKSEFYKKYLEDHQE